MHEEFFSNQIIYKPGSVEMLPSRASHLSSPPIAQRIERFSFVTILAGTSDPKITRMVALQQTGFTAWYCHQDQL